MVDPSTASPGYKWGARITLAIAFIALAVGFACYVLAVRKAVPFPFELDYGEGIVWEQMRQIVAGHGYGPIEVFPAIVFHYPPLYHLLAAGFAAVSGFDQLAAGRLLSALSTIATGGFIALIVTRMTRVDGARGAWICGLIAGLMIFGLMPVLMWSRMMRVDMVALLFSFAGLYFGLRALVVPRAVHFAALCFVAAIFTKQTMIAAPVAVFATLLVIRPRTAWPGIVTAMVTALTALAILTWQTDGGFLHHIVLYNINRIQPGRMLQIFPAFGQHGLYFGVAAIGIAHRFNRRRQYYSGCHGYLSLRQRLRGNLEDGQFVMVAGYFLLATLMLVTVAKSGSNYNYFIEWLSVTTILAGLALRDAAVQAWSDGKSAPLLRTAMIPLAIAIQACLLPHAPNDDWLMSAGRRVELDRLSNMIRVAQQPVISDEMVMLLRSGKTVLWEPAIFAELGSHGIWDERPFIAKIRHRDFAFFVTVNDRGNSIFDDRYNPKVADAMQAAYPRKQIVAGYTLHLRALPITPR
ncbi:glycosyltransferase family 39 protein [Sphingomonas sp.]|uniref:ArnT family glycosyltransferase n=1 Tax=Sphingomonas sp. TaxID=28214 RepID=UPI0025EDF6C1|nr:glycosyltransferase family 39 protein [Sphingomonas sp.]